MVKVFLEHKRLQGLSERVEKRWIERVNDFLT